MSDFNETQQTQQPPSEKKKVDILQTLFWLSLAAAGAAAGVALTWGEKIGMASVVLLIALGSLAAVLLLWVTRGAGRKLGVFPERGAAEEAAQKVVKGFSWLESLSEPALVTERGGAVVTANAAYRKLAEQAHEMGESGPIPTVDRLFGANPGLAAPIFRLAKSVKVGGSREEILPALMFGDSDKPVQFTANVSAVGASRALWRLRKTDGSDADNSAVDPRALYVEDAPVGFFSARRDGRVVYVNASLRKMLSLPDELGGLRMDDLMRPEGLKLMRKETRGGASQRADVVLRSRNGVELPALLTTSWTGKGPDALSRSVVHLGYSAENPPKQEKEDMAVQGLVSPGQVSDDTMFTDAPFGVVRLEGDGVETAVMMDLNRALRDMTEARAQPGARFADLFIAEDGEEGLASMLAKALDGAVELKLASDTIKDPKDAKTVDVFIALDRRGRPAAAYVIDTTEKKTLELRLAQGEKMQAIGQLAGGIAHDFNNLLQGIMLNTDKLLIRHPPGDPSFFDLKQMYELAARGAEMISMLLAWSRKQTFRQEVLDPSEMLSSYYVLLRQIIDERIKLDIVHGRDLPQIRADRGQLETALTNLCTNARDAMLEKNGSGELIVKTSRADAAMARKDGFNHVQEGDYLLIEVVDNGTGIPPELVEEIFQPFFTTKKQGEGTGLGLASVYGIVKQSGGYVYPVSKVGRGTTFKIFMPAYVARPEEKEAADKAAERAASEAETAAAVNEIAEKNRPKDLAGRGRIMLVEDEDSVRGLASHLLSTFGYQVIEAADGEEALELIQENAGQIDLLISDVVLPGMDGPALLKEAKPYLTGARVMFISGYAERDLAKTLDEEREISFLPKPFTLRQLAERVKDELNIVEAA